MDWHRNIIAECMVVEDVDGEEQHNIDHPAAQGDLVGRNEETTALIKLSDKPCHGDKDELDKSQ